MMKKGFFAAIVIVVFSTELIACGQETLGDNVMYEINDNVFSGQPEVAQIKTETYTTGNERIEVSLQDKRTDDIENKVDVNDSTGKPENVSIPQTITDVPIDEDTYHEAHRYSDTVESIQAAISKAMCNGELPFVTASGIYEDPLRIEVTVNTHDEVSLQKVLDYDTAGGIVRVVYSESAAVLE